MVSMVTLVTLQRVTMVTMITLQKVTMVTMVTMVTLCRVTMVKPVAARQEFRKPRRIWRGAQQQMQPPLGRCLKLPQSQPFLQLKRHEPLYLSVHVTLLLKSPSDGLYFQFLFVPYGYTAQQRLDYYGFFLEYTTITE